MTRKVQVVSMVRLIRMAAVMMWKGEVMKVISLESLQTFLKRELWAANYPVDGYMGGKAVCVICNAWR